MQVLVLSTGVSLVHVWLTTTTTAVVLVTATQVGEEKSMDGKEQDINIVQIRHVAVRFLVVHTRKLDVMPVLHQEHVQERNIGFGETVENGYKYIT